MTTGTHSQSASAREKAILISDLFHALNQPLSSLHCALELMMVNPAYDQTGRQTLSEALAQVGQIAEYASDIHELCDADGTSSKIQLIALDEFVRDILVDLSQAAENARIHVSLQAEACHVLFGEQRLRQALARVLEYAFAEAMPGQSIHMELAKSPTEAQLILRLQLPRNPWEAAEIREYDPRERHTRDCRQNLRLSVAHALLAGGGGGCQAYVVEKEACLRVCLPLAP